MHSKICRALLPLVLFLPRISVGAEAEVIQILQDFEAAERESLPPINHWRWSEEDKADAARFSQVEAVSTNGSEGRQLRVRIGEPLPSLSDFYQLISLNVDQLPPETSALRLRVKVISGHFRLTVGGPTSYFATSDVFAEPQNLEPGEWQTVDLSLVEDLNRNYRRPIFSRESPVIYYTRWIQEPLRINVSADSMGEMLIDDIELIATGKGRPFPSFAAADIRPLRSSADFEKAFTFSTDDREFELSYDKEKDAIRKPAILQTPTEGRGRLQFRMLGLEEMSFVGVRADLAPESNAVRLNMKVDHPGSFEDLSVDFLALVAPPDADIPWQQLGPGAGQSASGKRGFDYCFSPGRTEGISWGFYHARRTVRNGEWSEVVIPWADFVCAYGAGEMRDRHLLQQPLKAGEVFAIALVSSYRQRRGETVFTLESIDSVHVPGSPAEHQSFHQIPDVKQIRLERSAGGNGGAARQVQR